MICNLFIFTVSLYPDKVKDIAKIYQAYTKAIPSLYQVYELHIYLLIKHYVMGTVKKGILGDFSGKVGSVVGSNWKGIGYIRSLPKKVGNPRTLPQKSHRTKFTFTIHFLQPMTDFLRTGWKLYAQRQSPFNAAVSYTFANAITGEYPDYKIDPNKLLLSRGALAAVSNASVRCKDGNVQFQWEDNTGVGSAKATDKALIAIVNFAKNQAVTITAGSARLDCVQNVNVPAEWIGDEVHTYMGFISENGMEVANSVYLGGITVEGLRSARND